MIATCPSGLTVELRKLKVAEANILADKQAQQKGVILDQLLAGVWLATLDSGPYKLQGKPDWEMVLSGDRFYAQMKVRMETHGADYEFKVPCPVCTKAISWSLDLHDLPVLVLKPEDAATFAAGNVFHDLGPDGRRYTFHLMTGKHEKKAQQILRTNQTTRITASLLARIDEIEGVQDRVQYINDLDFTEALDLVKTLDSHDCGVETEFDVVCTECSAHSPVTLPLDQRGYWAPPRKATKSAS